MEIGNRNLFSFKNSICNVPKSEWWVSSGFSMIIYEDLQKQEFQEKDKLSL